MSAKRLREDPTSEVVASGLAKQAKAAATAIIAATNELMCPITQDLLYRPVLAGDGRFYEEWAIRVWVEQHSRTPGGGALRSPVTNEAMSIELSGPNLQLTNVVNALVDSGELSEEVVSSYRKRVKGGEDFREWLQKAQDDHPDRKEARKDAIFMLVRHYSGDNRVSGKDHKEARKWGSLGTKLGCMRCMAVYAEYLLEGTAGRREVVLGMHYATVAAAAGSDVAAFRLGMLLAQKPPYRTSLFEPDVSRAIEYLKQVVEKSLPLKHISPVAAKRAEVALKELVAQVDEDSE